MSSDNAQSASSSCTDNISQPFPLSLTLLRCLFSIQHISTLLSAASSSPLVTVFMFYLCRFVPLAGPRHVFPLPLDMQRDTGLPHQTNGSGTGTTRTATSLMHRVCSAVQAGNNDTFSNHSKIIETVPEKGTLFSHFYLLVQNSLKSVTRVRLGNMRGVRQIFVQTLPNPES